MYRFPGSRHLQWLLLFPLAIPAYVGAYALVDFLDYAGPLQSSLRVAFGWTNSRDYWFPEIRSRGAAVVVLTAALYPYVFLLVRSALREQSQSVYEVARALGAGPARRFWQVGLPLARPAIAAGSAIVMMETVSDFGVVAHFSVQTLTTGIFTTWLEGGNRSGAAQIASIILVIVLVLVVFEKYSRGKSRFYQTSKQHKPIEPQNILGIRGWLTTIGCFLPIAIGFILPVGVMAFHAFEKPELWVDRDLLRALVNTLFVGGMAALITVVAAVYLVYGARLASGKIASKLLPVTTIGYAAPGAVLAVGILYILSLADHFVANLVEKTTGVDIGLLMTGSAFAIIFAYSVRFFAIAQGATDAAFGRVPPTLPMASRSLGKGPGETLRLVYFPLIRGSVGTALLLVFVDSVKELPATLLLRPFNFNTLATRVYEKASLEQIDEASPAALMVILVGVVAVLLVVRANRIVAR